MKRELVILVILLVVIAALLGFKRGVFKKTEVVKNSGSGSGDLSLGGNDGSLQNSVPIAGGGNASTISLNSGESAAGVPKKVVDNRLSEGAPIVGFVGGTEELVLDKTKITENQIIETTLDGRPFAVIVQLDKHAVAGVTVAYKDGRLHLLWQDGKLIDKETKSVWDSITMTAIEGQFKGSQMGAVPARDSFWGVWTQVFKNSRIL